MDSLALIKSQAGDNFWVSQRKHVDGTLEYTVVGWKLAQYQQMISILLEAGYMAELCTIKGRCEWRGRMHVQHKIYVSSLI